jgi:hypothetical protein
MEPPLPPSEPMPARLLDALLLKDVSGWLPGKL